MLTADQIKANWEDLIQFITNNFQGDRQTKLLKLHTDMDQRIAEAPASSKIYFHGAFPGGYVNHVLNVLKMAPKVSELWNTSGGSKSYTDDELLFSALCHDLGKLGSLDEPYFIPTYEQWKIKRGIRYDGNPAVEYMKTADNYLYFLQAYDIQTTHQEYLAIKLHDGLYDESNKSYFISYSPNNKLNILSHLLHTADFYAMQLEYEEWRNTLEAQQFLDGQINSNTKTSRSTPKKLVDTLTKNTNVDDYNPDMFDKIFGTTGEK